MTDSKKLRQFLDGVVARGWPYPGRGPIDFSAEPARGYVQLAEDGTLVFEAIDEDPFGSGEMAWEREVPRAYALATPVGGAILANLRPAFGGTFSVGGSTESVYRVVADTVIFGVDLHEVTRLQFDNVAVTFPGLAEWAGMTVVSRTVRWDKKGVTGQTIDITEPKSIPATAAASKSLKLVGKGDWRVSTPGSGALGVQTGLQLTLNAGRPRPVGDFAEVLADMQDLLAVANRGFICAEAAPSQLTNNGGTALVWNRLLMHMPPHAIQRKSTSFARPTYMGDDLGGMSGLARWTRATARLRPIVNVVTSVYRDGPESVESSTRSLGAAIELYVAAHTRTAKWAVKKGKPKGFTYTQALAGHAGPEFHQWVGDAKVWADAFHGAYLGSKHLRRSGSNAGRDMLLARSARWLLTATLMNRAAGNRAPSRQTFTSSELQNLGAAVRRELGT